MPEKIDLFNLEKQTWKLQVQDGFKEIILGMILIMAAGSFLARIPLYFFTIIPLIIILKIRNTILTPRVGKIKLGPYRKKKELQFSVILTGSLLLFLPLLIYATKYLHIETTAIIFTTASAIIFSLYAYFFENPLFLFYGTLCSISGIALNTIGNPWGPITAFISGTIMLIIGLIILIDFLDKYPVIHTEIFNEGLQ